MTEHAGSGTRTQRKPWATRLLSAATLSLTLSGLLGCPASDPLGAPPSQAMAPALQPVRSRAFLPDARPASQSPTTSGVPNQSAAAQAATTALTPAARADALKTQQLIVQAERSYASGVTNYRAGHLDAARTDFDAAVDLLLTSGMNIQGDPALADEMEHLLNAVNSLEMAALKTGNGFSAPVEPTPLDAADEVTFAPNAALTAKVETELKTTQSDLPLVVNEYVTGFINYYSNSAKGHASLLRSLERAGKYKDMIQKTLRDAGLPQDLIYLAVAESAFQPQALNAKSGAGGMWQFMPFQGAYGLARNGYFDERFDPEKSSIAYARYMKSLYNQFGDWYLAMAAYDWGPGYVQRAVMKTGYADYWELYRRGVLPGETKNYVPGIIAAAIMAKNPAQYGLEDLHPMPPVIYDTVRTESAVDLRLVADVTDVSTAEIVALNPSLLRATTPADMSFDLHIPAGTKVLFADRIKEVPVEHRATWRFRVVRPGETIDGIATAMHAPVEQIAEANGLSAEGNVAPGDELVIPVTPAISIASGRVQRYRALRGDTLVTVADRFNVSVTDLRRWNGMRASAIMPGRSLVVSEPVRLAPTGRVRARASRHPVSASRGGLSARGTTRGATARGKRSAVARTASSTRRRRKTSR